MLKPFQKKAHPPSRFKDWPLSGKRVSPITAMSTLLRDSSLEISAALALFSYSVPMFHVPSLSTFTFFFTVDLPLNGISASIGVLARGNVK